MLNYWEQKYQFCEGVLESPEKYYNDNIVGRLYKRNRKTAEKKYVV